MSSLCVFTTGSDLELFLYSCARVGIVPATYEAAWKDYVHVKLIPAIPFLESRTEDYAMWVDGNDSLIIQPEEEILRRMAIATHPIFISAERNCWPDPQNAPMYAQRDPSASDPKFINAGGFIGPRKLLIKYMKTVLSYADDSGDDQRAWIRAYLAGALPDLWIDHGRWIFSSVADGREAEQADCCVKHWNGKIRGRQEYWEGLK